MTTAILLIAAITALLALFLFGHTLDLLRQVLALRHHEGFVDEPQRVPYNADVMISDLPIPAVRDLGDDDRAALLIVSEHCVTCHGILERVPAVWTENLLVLVQSATALDATDWLAQHRLRFNDQIVYDEGRLLAAVLGVFSSPAIVAYEGPRPLTAFTVPSARQLDRVAEWLVGTLPELKYS